MGLEFQIFRFIFLAMVSKSSFGISNKPNLNTNPQLSFFLMKVSFGISGIISASLQGINSTSLRYGSRPLDMYPLYTSPSFTLAIAVNFLYGSLFSKLFFEE